MNILYTNNELCQHCYACVRACPVNAISFQDDKVTISKNDCILCGNCARVCTQGAKIFYNDIPVVQKWINQGQEVVAVVAPSFAASFHNNPKQFIGSLRELGFSHVFETAFGAEICAHEYQKLLASSNNPIIATPCPSLVLLVEKHFPQLINCLAPIKSPMMITGEVAKELHPNCKTVFIGPCIAKKAESVNEQAGSGIDAVVTFKQINKWLYDRQINLEKISESNWDTPGANVARLFPVASGLLKTLDLHQDTASLDVIEANGTIKCKSILRSIISGLLTPKIVDLLCCDGCINGLEMDSEDLCFVKHKNVINYFSKSKLPGDYKYPADYSKLAPNIDTRRSFVNKQRINKLYTRKEIWSVLNQIGKYQEKDLVNCGACGYESCWKKAISVLQGKADPGMCLPYLLAKQKESFKQMSALLLLSRRLEDQAVTDSLTGLYNLRAYQKEIDQRIELSKETNKTFALYIIDIDFFKQFNDLYGHQAGDKVIITVANILKDVFKDGFVARYGGEEFVVIQPNVSPIEALDLGRVLSTNIKDNKYNTFKDKSEITLTVSVGIACFPVNATNKYDLLKLADYSMYKAKKQQDNVVLYSSVLDEISPQSYKVDEKDIGTIKTLNIVINAKDQYTYKHSERVVYYAEALARKLTLSQEDIKYLKYGAFLHDIGKIKVDMSILQKPGRLSKEEYEIIMQHPAIGADMIKEIPHLHQAMPVIMYHHERYDGRGYPFGLQGNNIHILGRIAAIADSFDAMTTNRPYKKALNYDQAANELINNSGTQFDPELVKCFLSCVKSITEV